MDSNPYSPPKAEVRDILDTAPDEARLAKLAAGQKLAIYAIALYLLAMLVQAATSAAIPASLAAAASGFTVVSGLIALILSLIGLWRMGYGLGIGTVVRVLMLLSVLVPLINILLLLVINARATRTLRRAGYKVGFFGVSR